VVRGMFLSLLSGPLEIHLHRGDLAEARRLYSLFSSLESSTDVQERACFFGAAAAMSRAEGRLREAFEAGRRASECQQTLRISHQAVEQGIVEALEAALALGERESARELLATIEAIPLGRRPPYLEAHRHRFRARLSGDPTEFETAIARFREIGIPFWLAVAQLEQAEALGGGSETEPLLAEARETFERLEAKPWLERLEAPQASARTEVPA
jgi:hypothetical protein